MEIKISLFVFVILFLQNKTFLSRTTQMIFLFYQGIADNAVVHLTLGWKCIPAAIPLF